MKKYKIYRRYSPLSGTWYIIKKRTFFGWHTLNLCFDELEMANQYLRDELNGYNDNEDNEICETPLIWNKKEQKYVEKYPCKTNLIKVE